MRKPDYKNQRALIEANTEIIGVDSIDMLMSSLDMSNELLRLKYRKIYAEVLTEMALTLFEWDNLPETMDARILEDDLIRTGNAVATKQKLQGAGGVEIIANGSLSADDMQVDIYGNPYKFRMGTRSNDNVYYDCNMSNSVICKNTPYSRPFIEKIMIWATMLAEIKMTQVVNLDQQKVQQVLLVNKDNKADVDIAINELAKFNPFLVLDEETGKDLSEAVNTKKMLNAQVPFTFNELETAKHHVMNEIYTLLGIDNANQMKTERLVSNEVEANDGQIALFRKMMLKERIKFAEAMNEKFGTNISVRFNESDDERMTELYNEVRIKRIEAEALKLELESEVLKYQLEHGNFDIDIQEEPEEGDDENAE